MKNNTSDILELINNAKSSARREAIKKFFIRKQKFVASIIVLAAIVCGSFFAFNLYQKSQQKKFSAIFHQALIDESNGEIEKSKTKLKQIYESSSVPSTLKSVVALRYAGLLLNEGKKSEAANIYLEAHRCNSCDEYIKDLAGLLAVKTWMSDEFEISKEDLVSKIEKIEKTSKYLKSQITEQRALLEMQKNNVEKSKEIFTSIMKDEKAPQAVKLRSENFLKILDEKKS